MPDTTLTAAVLALTMAATAPVTRAADGPKMMVPEKIKNMGEVAQGEVLDVEMAAASPYPRSHGTRYRRESGMPCGSLQVRR